MFLYIVTWCLLGKLVHMFTASLFIYSLNSHYIHLRKRVKSYPALRISLQVLSFWLIRYPWIKPIIDGTPVRNIVSKPDVMVIKCPHFERCGTGTSNNTGEHLGLWVHKARMATILFHQWTWATESYTYLCMYHFGTYTPFGESNLHSECEAVLNELRLTTGSLKNMSWITCSGESYQEDIQVGLQKSQCVQEKNGSLSPVNLQMTAFLPTSWQQPH